MPSGHGRDDYTMQRMLERRSRNNIRKVLGRNGRRLTAKVTFFFWNFRYNFCIIYEIAGLSNIILFLFQEIDIVNLCTRYPEQRYE
jgi:hypothetical protein